MRRLLVNLLTGLSLLLCISSAGLWVRSYWAEDFLNAVFPSRNRGIHLLVHSRAGAFTGGWSRYPLSDSILDWDTDTNPAPPDDDYLAALYSFYAGPLPFGRSGGYEVTVPHGAAAAVFAAPVAIRLVRRRRSPARGFPVNPAATT